jgi:hypothetical protein
MLGLRISTAHDAMNWPAHTMRRSSSDRLAQWSSRILRRLRAGNCTDMITVLIEGRGPCLSSLGPVLKKMRKLPNNSSAKSNKGSFFVLARCRRNGWRPPCASSRCAWRRTDPVDGTPVRNTATTYPAEFGSISFRGTVAVWILALSIGVCRFFNRYRSRARDSGPGIIKATGGLMT